MISRPRYERLVREAALQVPEVNLARARDLVAAGGLLLDVREADEFSEDRLPGAHHLGKGVLEGRIEALAPDPATPLVCYCATGKRSLLAGLSLRAMGYTAVFSLAGGIEAVPPAERAPAA